MHCESNVTAPAHISIFTATASGVFAIIATTGNALIILAVFKDPLKKLRTPFSYFLVNLATSDLIVGGVILPISVYVHGMEATGYLNCTLMIAFHIIYFIAATSSIFSLLALCVDRYIAVAFPIKYRIYLHWKKCMCISVLIWVVSISLPFLHLKLSTVTFLMVYDHIAVLTAFIGLLVTYIRIYVLLRKQGKSLSLAQQTSPVADNLMKKKWVNVERKVTRTFLLILMVFVVTYLPAVFIAYMLEFYNLCTENEECREWLRDIQFLLVCSNACVNPFICILRMQNFRSSIAAMCCQSRCCKTRMSTKSAMGVANINYIEDANQNLNEKHQ